MPWMCVRLSSAEEMLVCRSCCSVSIYLKALDANKVEIDYQIKRFNVGTDVYEGGLKVPWAIEINHKHNDWVLMILLFCLDIRSNRLV